MRKLLLVLIGLILFSSITFAQQDTIGIGKSVDLYLPVDSIEMPKVFPKTPTQFPAPVILSSNSSHGAGKNYSEHLLWCNSHREYSFKTKKWTLIPAKPLHLCHEVWGKYLQTKNKIGYEPLYSPLYSVEVR